MNSDELRREIRRQAARGNNALGLGPVPGLSAMLIAALPDIEREYGKSLQGLSLNQTQVSNEAVIALVQSEHMASLQRLHLLNTLVTDKAVIALARSEHMASLQTLFLGGTAVGDDGVIALARSKHMASLRTLHLAKTRVSLPERLIDTCNAQEIFRFLRGQEEARGAEALSKEVPRREFKMLIVGQGESGKTHLRKRVFENAAEHYDEHEPTTHNFRIVTWGFDAPIEPNGWEVRITANIWDFGGQDELHSTHRFFLSGRSMYILCVDVTKSHAATRVDYWLDMIEHEAEGCPVIVLLTKCDIPKPWPLLNRDGDEKSLSVEEWREAIRARHPQIELVDVIDGYGFDERSNREKAKRERHEQATRNLGNAIRAGVLRIPGISDPYPMSLQELMNWFDGVFKGENRETKANTRYRKWVRFEAMDPGEFGFLDTCRACGVDPNDRETYLKLLCDLGRVHWAGDRKNVGPGHSLKNVILNPSWVKEPVYRLIRSADLARKNGRLTYKQIEQVLPIHDGAAAAQTLFDELVFRRFERESVLELMTALELAFRLHQSEHQFEGYLIPDHLQSRHKPRLWTGRDDLSGVAFEENECEFLADSLFLRFIGRMARFVDWQHCFRDEVLLDFDAQECEALVRADVDARQVYIQVRGDPVSRVRVFAEIREKIWDLYEPTWREWRGTLPESVALRSCEIISSPASRPSPEHDRKGIPEVDSNDQTLISSVRDWLGNCLEMRREPDPAVTQRALMLGFRIELESTRVNLAGKLSQQANWLCAWLVCKTDEETEMPQQGRRREAKPVWECIQEDDQLRQLFPDLSNDFDGYVRTLNRACKAMLGSRPKTRSAQPRDDVGQQHTDYESQDN